MSWWTPVRPGEVVKNAFLSTGATYSISQLFRVYRNTIAVWNEEHRPARKDRFRGMRYNSFRTYIYRWIKGGLLEKVGEEPMQFDGERKLVGIRDGQVVEQTMVMLNITDAGRAEEQGWLTPQIYDLPVEERPAYEEARKRPAKRLEEPELESEPELETELEEQKPPARKKKRPKPEPAPELYEGERKARKLVEKPEPEAEPKARGKAAPVVADLIREWNGWEDKKPRKALKQLKALRGQYKTGPCEQLIQDVMEVKQEDFAVIRDYKNTLYNSWKLIIQCLKDMEPVISQEIKPEAKAKPVKKKKREG